MSIGRPSKYNDKVVKIICEETSTSSKSLKTICDEPGMPSVSSVLLWLTMYPDFSDKYARAKEAQADFMAEEILAIADDGSNDFMTIVKGDMSYEVENKEVTNRSKLRVDARKWLASKLRPKKYGDRTLNENQQLDKDGNPTNPGPALLLAVPTAKLSQIEQLLREGE